MGSSVSQQRRIQRHTIFPRLGQHSIPCRRNAIMGGDPVALAGLPDARCALNFTLTGPARNCSVDGAGHVPIGSAVVRYEVYGLLGEVVEESAVCADRSVATWKVRRRERESFWLQRKRGARVREVCRKAMRLSPQLAINRDGALSASRSGPRRCRPCIRPDWFRCHDAVGRHRGGSALVTS